MHSNEYWSRSFWATRGRWSLFGQCFSKNGSRFTLRYDELRGRDSDDSRDVLDIKIKWKGAAVRGRFDDNLVELVGDTLYQRNQTRMNKISLDSIVEGFTEYRVGKNVFQAHPYYRGQGQWYDWAKNKFDEQRKHVPARIKMFLDLSHCNFINQPIST